MSEPVAFEDFFTETHVRVRASLLAAIGDRDLAFEAADEAFARAFLDWERVSRMEAPRAWVSRVALNVARRRMRRRALEERLLRRSLPRTEMPAPAGEVWDLVSGLPERQRVAVVLRYVGDLTEEQIGEAMGIKRGTVSRTLGEAQKRLAIELRADESTGDSHERV